MERGARVFSNGDDPEFGLVLTRLRQGKQNLSTSRRVHICSTKTCNPESEQQLIQGGTLPGPAISSNIYLCAYGKVHICSKESCTEYSITQNQTCPITGIQHDAVVSNYDKNNSKTWFQLKDTTGALVDSRQDGNLIEEEDEPLKKPVATKKRKTASRGLLSKGSILERAREIIVNLLYSSARTKRNAVALEANRVEALKARETYINLRRTHSQQLPYLTDIYRIMTCKLTVPLPLREFELDSARVDYYAHIVFQVWNLLQRYHVPANLKVFDADTGTEIVPRLNFEIVTLGVLYSMRNGITLENYVMLPRDEFLDNNLPRINDDLNYFGVEKKKVTRGTALLIDLYNAAFSRDNLKPEQLMLDMNELPQKHETPQLFRLGTS